MKEALASSLNVPAVKVEMLTGIPRVLSMAARALGVTTLGPPRLGLRRQPHPGQLPGAARAARPGGDGVRRQGWFRAEHVLLSVRDRTAASCWPGDRGHRALDPGVAFVMNRILTDDANRAPVFGAHSALTVPGHTVAAKTGTTTGFRDNLTVGLDTAAGRGHLGRQPRRPPMRNTTGLSGRRRSGTR